MSRTIDPEKEIRIRKFLEAWYGEANCSIPKACEIAGIPYDTYYKNWRYDPTFTKRLHEYDVAVFKENLPRANRAIKRRLEKDNVDAARIVYQREKLLNNSADVVIPGDIKMIVQLDDGQKIGTEVKEPDGENI